MQIKGEAGKGLIAAAIVSANVFLGGCDVPKTNVKEPEETYVIRTLVQTSEDNNTYSVTYFNEDDLEYFDTEKMFTVFSGTKLYVPGNGTNSLSFDTNNKQTMCIKGIATYADMTLVEFPNGQRKYVKSSDIVEMITFDLDNTENKIFNYDFHEEDYTVNKDAYVYNRWGVCYGHVCKGVRCIEIGRTSGYVFVISENDEYFYIKESDLTLTKELNKGLFKTKKLDKTDKQLSEYNIRHDYANDGDYLSYEVTFNNEVFTPINEEEPYRTLLRERQIYFRNGSIEPVTTTEGIRVKIISESDDISYVEFSDGSHGYVNSRSLCSCITVDRDNFTPILRNRNMITNDWDYLYDTTGAYQYSLTPNTECMALEADGTYTLVEFKDGTRGYLKYSNLIPSENQVSKYVYIKDGTTFYHKNNDDVLEETYDDYLYGGNILYLLFTEGEYAYVGDYRGIDCAYVKLSDIDFNYNVEGVFSYAYVNRNTTMNSKIDGTGENVAIDDYDLIWIHYNCGEYSYVQSERNWNDGGFYIKTNEIAKIPGDFIFIDLDEQRMYCYDDNDGGRYTSKDWGTRSGKDSTPSHEGLFDIDWKAENWEFTTYRGSYARHWIPYNEYGEGIHDLIGDDEQNYGNEAYHQCGSHGCVRVPAEASEYVYNNYPVGTMVLVHKK